MTTVWVLTITHKHGTDVRAFATEDGALNALGDYTGEWWESVADVGSSDGSPVPEPTDRDERITRYFEQIGDEWFTLEQVTIEP